MLWSQTGEPRTKQLHKLPHQRKSPQVKAETVSSIADNRENHKKPKHGRCRRSNCSRMVCSLFHVWALTETTPPKAKATQSRHSISASGGGVPISHRLNEKESEPFFRPISH